MGILGTLRDLPPVICRRYGFWDGAAEETLGPLRWLAAAAAEAALPDDDEDDDDDDDPAATGGSGGGGGGGAELPLVSAMGLTVASIGSH